MKDLQNIFGKPLHFGRCILPLAVLLLIATPGSWAQTPGTLDPNFDADGKVTVPFSSGPVRGYATCPDWVTGGLFLAGYQTTASNESIAIARLAPDGSLSTSFDGDGKVLATYGTNEPYSRAYGIARSVNSQTIVVVGESRQTVDGVARFGVARFNAGTGTFDQGFSGDGRTSFSFIPGANCRAWDVAVQQDDKIVVAGWTNTTTDPDSEINFAVARLLPNGNFDNSFSADGKIMVDLDTYNGICHSVIIQPDGKILLAGTRESTPSTPFIPGTFLPNFVLARLNTDGTLDNSFGTDGISGNYNAPSREGWGIDLQPDGKVVMVGFSTTAAGGAPIVMRFDADGSGDSTFGSGGQVQVFNFDSKYYDVKVQTDGKIICTGEETFLPANPNGLITWLDTNGDPDPSIGPDGSVSLDFGTWTDDGLRDAYISSNGRLTVLGTTDLGGDRQFAAARFISLNVGILDFDLRNETMNVYPNPIQETTTLTYSLASNEQLTIGLLDMQGRPLCTYLSAQEKGPGEHNQAITIPSDLAPGNYMLVLSSPKGKMSVQITKQ